MRRFLQQVWEAVPRYRVVRVVKNHGFHDLPYYVRDLVPDANGAWTISGAYWHRNEAWTTIVKKGKPTYIAAMKSLVCKWETDVAYKVLSEAYVAEIERMKSRESK